MTKEELFARRKALGLGSKAFAREVGVDDRTVRRWESGEREIPAMLDLVLAYWERDQADGRGRICFSS